MINSAISDMNFVDNLDAQNIVYFLPVNLTSVSSLETHSQSLLCFLPTELNVSLGGPQSTRVWV